MPVGSLQWVLQWPLGSSSGGLVESLPGILEAALPDQFVPDGLGVLMRRPDGHDARLASAGHGSVAQARFVVQAGELESLLESLNGSPEFFGRRAIPGGRG